MEIEAQRCGPCVITTACGIRSLLERSISASHATTRPEKAVGGRRPNIIRSAVDRPRRRLRFLTANTVIIETDLFVQPLLRSAVA